jgi:hypothetical protein
MISQMNAQQSLYCKIFFFEVKIFRAKNPEILGNEKRKSGLKELQENYGKRLNDCILKNTDLRTNIAQLEDEKILLEQRNANIENNSAEDIDSQIDSGIDSVFLGSAISGGIFDSQIVPLTIGNFKRKNNNFV